MLGDFYGPRRSIHRFMGSKPIIRGYASVVLSVHSTVYLRYRNLEPPGALRATVLRQQTNTH